MFLEKTRTKITFFICLMYCNFVMSSFRFTECDDDLLAEKMSVASFEVFNQIWNAHKWQIRESIKRNRENNVITKALTLIETKDNPDEDTMNVLEQWDFIFQSPCACADPDSEIPLNPVDYSPPAL